MLARFISKLERFVTDIGRGVRRLAIRFVDHRAANRCSKSRFQRFLLRPMLRVMKSAWAWICGEPLGSDACAANRRRLASSSTACSYSLMMINWAETDALAAEDSTEPLRFLTKPGNPDPRATDCRRLLFSPPNRIAPPSGTLTTVLVRKTRNVGI